MKKIALLALMSFGVFVTSCSNEEAVEGLSETTKMEGKWVFSKFGKTVNNQEVLTDYPHSDTNVKDYILLNEDGTGTQHFYYKPEGSLKEEKSSFTWSKTESTFQLNNFSSQIMHLTSQELKMKNGNNEIMIYNKG